MWSNLSEDSIVPVGHVTQSEVTKSMATPRWYLVTSTLLAVVTAMGVLLLVQKVSPPASPRSDVKIEDRRNGDSTVFEVKFGRVGATINELGLVEPTRNIDFFCRVEGQWTIISLIPEGTRVAKGQLVCELDSAALNDKLTLQFIATSGAEAAYQNAKLTREAAEVDVVDYQERIYRQESLAIAAEIAAAEAALRETEAQRELARLARKRLDDLPAKQKDEWTPAEIVADLEVAERLAATASGLAREKAVLEQAKARQEIFEKFTREKTIRGIRSEIEKARTHELETKRGWDRERATEAKLQFLIRNCKLVADFDGVLTYANERDLSGAVTSAKIGEGLDGPRAAKALYHLRPERPDAGQCQGARISHRVGHPRSPGPDHVRGFRGRERPRNGRGRRASP